MGPLDTVLWFLPEVVLLAAALLIFVLDAFGVRRIEVDGGIAIGGAVVGIGLVLADLGWAPLAFARTIPTAMVNAPIGANALWAFTSLGLIFQGIFLASALLVSIASLSRPSAERGAAVFFGLLTIATLGMLLAAVAANLVFLLLAIEVVSIASYLLVGYTRRESRNLEAAMKFYIIGALSAALAFFGASLLFGAYGSLSFLVLAQFTAPVGNASLAWIGYGFLIAGIGFKVTAVPFHMWAVDVYDGAPTDVSAFLAGGTKKVGVFAFFLVFIGPITFFAVHPSTCPGAGCPGSTNFGPAIQLALALLAILTMTVGNLLALLQREMKRMLAYSSISQAGYMLIGIAVGTSPAIAGATFQVFGHVFMKAGAFLVVAAVASLGVGPMIDDWRGLGTRRPYLALAFSLMLLSLAGIPLTVGFASKFVLFSSAVEAQGVFVWLAVAGLLNSALSVFYYARVLKAMYFDRPEPGTTVAALSVANGPVSRGARQIGYGRAVAIGLATAAIIAFGVYPQIVLGPIQSAAAHFLSIGV